MKRNRLLMSIAGAAVWICMAAMGGSARAAGVPNGAMQAGTTETRGAQQRADWLPSEDFAGVILTDEQRAQIAKIHQSTESRKAAATKDSKLTTEQRDAVLQQYTSLERGMVFRLLTPVQRRQVLQQARARRAAEVAAQRKQ